MKVAAVLVVACILLGLGAPALPGASRDVGLLVAPVAAPSGADMNITELHEWPGDDDRTPTIDQTDGSADLSLVPDGAWNAIVSLGFYELSLDPAQPVANDPARSRLGYGELELFPRRFSRSGTVVGCDLDLDYARSSGAFSWQRCDGSVVLFVHLQAQATSSWMVELIATTQRELHLPAAFPGLAYCHLDPHLQWSLGFPFSSLHWQPRPDWTISGQVADNSQLSVVYGSGMLQPGLVASRSTTVLRVSQEGERGDAVSYAETGLTAQLTLIVGRYGSLVAGAGRALLRVLHEPTQNLRLGSAWQSTLGGEFDF